MMTARVPIDTYILKVASRCNLNCSYCYVYNMGDETYRAQPYRMSEEVTVALLNRVATHCRQESIREVNFVFHGGEPLLAGKRFFREFVASACTLLSDVDPTYVVQTNGTLLTKEWLDTFYDLGIGFGISLDGPPEIHDANRIDHSGRGTYVKVRRAVEAVLADQRMSGLFGGVLTVINLASDPLKLYRHIKELGVGRCDFLLPDATYDHLPHSVRPMESSTPYADWLIAVFDEWFENQEVELSIRLFEDIIELLLGGGSGNDALGGGRNGVLVIETDGGIEPIDALKVCGGSLTKIGLNVLRDNISDACSIDLVRMYQEGAARLCAICLSCPVVDVCGGGYLPHRFSSKTGFANPSIYCRDLMKLIIHIRTQVLRSFPTETRLRLGLVPISFEEAIGSVSAEPDARTGDPR